MILLTVIPLSGAHCGESDYDADLADKALFDGRPKIWVELKSRKAPSQSGTPASDRPTEKKRNGFFYYYSFLSFNSVMKRSSKSKHRNYADIYESQGIQWIYLFTKENKKD